VDDRPIWCGKPATTEALAILRSLKFVEQLGHTAMAVELDWLELIQSCNWVIKVWSPYSAIMATISPLILAYGNQVAHELARNSYISKELVAWDVDPPSYIFTICNS
jgi:hypothetical protein